MSSPKNIGKFGEKRVARKLDWLSKEYITLNDVLLPTRYGTTQIDHIVVSPYAIFVIETKNYKGWIFGHQDSEEWKQSLLGKKRFWGWSSEQHKLRNPIRQNAAHARAVKAILKEVGDFNIILDENGNYVFTEDVPDVYLGDFGSLTTCGDEMQVWVKVGIDNDNDPYIEDLRDITLEMRGSSNQRIINLREIDKD